MSHGDMACMRLRWSPRVMPAQLKELMRHESIGTTMKFYVGQNADSTAATLWKAVSCNTSRNTEAESATTGAKEKPQPLTELRPIE